MKCIKLVNGNDIEMPIVGLGTWRAQADETENAVTEALNCGYRHIGKEYVKKLRNFNKNRSIIYRYCV